MLMVLMEIMKPLRKLSSKLGGLVKIAISYGGFNPDGSKGTYSPNTSISSSTYDDFSQQPLQDRIHLALDTNHSLKLNPEEVQTFNKLPESAYTYVNKYTGPKVPMVNSDGTPFQNSSDPNTFIQNPTDYKVLGTGSGGYMRSPNSLESGRTGVIKRFSPTNVQQVTGNMPSAYDRDTAKQLGQGETPGENWYEMKSDPTSITRLQARRLNAPYAFKKDKNLPTHHTNAKTVRTLPDGSKQFTDPFLNRRKAQDASLGKIWASRNPGKYNPYLDKKPE